MSVGVGGDIITVTQGKLGECAFYCVQKFLNSCCICFILPINFGLVDVLSYIFLVDIGSFGDSFEHRSFYLVALLTFLGQNLCYEVRTEAEPMTVSALDALSTELQAFLVTYSHNLFWQQS